jgi:hypothetical protein
MMRVYAAMAQKKQKLISERTLAALPGARARGTVLGGHRRWRPLLPRSAVTQKLHFSNLSRCPEPSLWRAALAWSGERGPFA